MVFENCQISAAITGNKPGVLVGNSFYKRVGLDGEKCAAECGVDYNKDLVKYTTGFTTITNCMFDGTLNVKSTDANFINHIQKCPWIGFFGDRNDGNPHHYNCSAPVENGSNNFAGATINVPMQP